MKSQIDPCVYIKENLLFCLYVDDAICLTPNKKEADKLIQDLKNKSYVLTDEGSLSEYLGVQVKCFAGNWKLNNNATTCFYCLNN